MKRLFVQILSVFWAHFRRFAPETGLSAPIPRPPCGRSAGFPLLSLARSGSRQPTLQNLKRGLFLCALLAASWVLPAAAFAHGVEVSEATGQVALRTARFMYSTGEPMLFAKVKVFTPSRPDAPAQESIADLNGYFSFVPFENGDWRLTAEDGMGHKGEIIIAVADDGAEPAGAAAITDKPPPAAPLPGLIAGVLGLSLILNIFALWYFVGLRKKGAVHAH